MVPLVLSRVLWVCLEHGPWGVFNSSSACAKVEVLTNFIKVLFWVVTTSNMSSHHHHPSSDTTVALSEAQGDPQAPLTDYEAELYDRSIRTWGIEAQQRYKGIYWVGVILKYSTSTTGYVWQIYCWLGSGVSMQRYARI